MLETMFQSWLLIYILLQGQYYIIEYGDNLSPVCINHNAYQLIRYYIMKEIVFVNIS